MSYRCEICNKKIVAGRTQRHRRGVAGKRWNNRAQMTKRVFKPNLQKFTITLKSGVKKQLKLCTSCIKKLKKTQKSQGAPLKTASI